MCWLTLGQPGKAATALVSVAESLPPAYQRDRGVALGQQAAALVAVGEHAEAAAAAAQAVSIARDAGSGRILRMVVPVAAALEAHGHLEAVAGLRAALAKVTAV